MKFKDIKFINRWDVNQAKIFFDNWYWVSIIRWRWTYGAEEGLYEMAVLIGDEHRRSICYNTPLTSDVLWYLTEKNVIDYIKKVKALPRPN